MANIYEIDLTNEQEEVLQRMSDERWGTPAPVGQHQDPPLPLPPVLTIEEIVVRIVDNYVGKKGKHYLKKDVKDKLTDADLEKAIKDKEDPTP
jgi:hypothetical protein